LYSHPNTVLNRSIRPLLILMVVSSWPQQVGADDIEWPREIRTPEADIVIYQPQLETFDGNKLTARAAVSVTKKDAGEPVFGAIWLASRVSIDRDERLVTFLATNVTDLRFPHADPAKLKQLKSILESRVPAEPLRLSLDRLLTMLELVEGEKRAAEKLNTTPPKILLVNHPAVLITIDGEPRLTMIEDSKLMRVVNTPYLIAYDPSTKTYYLSGGGRWLSAQDILGPWQDVTAVPKEVEALVTGDAASDSESRAGVEAQPELDGMPHVIVAIEPTELIQSGGGPEFGAISGTDLLYVTNTESDVIIQTDPQQIYVLLSGRWFTAAAKDGPWSYVPPDQLPADFAKIPPGSEIGHVLASVAGTQEAKDAVLETGIPQTAAIKRSEASLSVEYDGEPKFDKVEGTEMYYSVNTPYSVIRVGSNYYCCHQAVWYEAVEPLGPWAVCSSVPQVIYAIPPSCPVYNVKYVEIYDSTPEVVYVGYTPGYVGCYVHGAVVVYGTGYHYPGWHGSAHYARPATWGFSVRYNPHTGTWAFRAGHAGPHGWVGVGGVHVGDGGIHGWRGGWWGSGGFRHADIDVDRRRGNVYRRPGHPANPRGPGDPRGVADPRGPRDPRGVADPRGARDPRGVADPRGARDPRGVADPRGPRDPRGVADPRGLRDPRGVADPRGARDPRGGRSRIARSNNVFADKQGNVHRKTLNGWEGRDKNGWSKPTDRTRSGTGQRGVDRSRSTDRGGSGRSARGASHSELERQSKARSRGNSRTRSYNRSASSSRGRSRTGSSRSSSGGRSGGRRRR